MPLPGARMLKASSPTRIRETWLPLQQLVALKPAAAAVACPGGVFDTLWLILRTITRCRRPEDVSWIIHEIVVGL